MSISRFRQIGSIPVVNQVVLWVFCAVATAAGPAPVGEMASLHEEVSGRYHNIYVPKDYDPNKKYPLVISSHGTYGNAERGRQACESDFVRFLGRRLDDYPGAYNIPEKHDLILLCMFFESAQAISWEAGVENDTAILLRLIDKLKVTYNIDPDAILLTGYSGGGHMMHYIGNRHPDLFRALVGRKANFNKDNAKWINDEIGKGARHLPIFMFRGGPERPGKRWDCCYNDVGDAYEWYTAKGYKYVMMRTFPDEGHSPNRRDTAVEWFMDLIRHNPVARFETKPGARANEVRFAPGKSHDPDGKIVRWHWEFGDGAESEERNPIHTYSGPGAYRVFLTIRDDSGREGSGQHVVEVTAGKD